MHKTSIILVAPQMGENIGAAARVMKNSGLTDLRIVNPRDGWPNEKAGSMAVGAIDIVNNARIFDELEEAITDLEYIYATTAAVRDMNKEYISSRQLQTNYRTDLKAGIMFGRENCGLKNSEIMLANKILTVDTTDFSSLNIAQAIAIICYELFANKTDIPSSNPQQTATRSQLIFFLKHLENELDNKFFFKVPEKKSVMMRNITNIFTRIERLSVAEIQTLHGIIKTIAGN